MAVNYFNEDGPGDIIKKAVAEVEYKLVGTRIPKLREPTGKKVVLSTVGGDIAESEIAVDSLVTKKAFNGGYIAITDNDGEVTESNKMLEDYDFLLTQGMQESEEKLEAMRGDVAEKLDKFPEDVEIGRPVVTAGGGSIAVGEPSVTSEQVLELIRTNTSHHDSGIAIKNYYRSSNEAFVFPIDMIAEKDLVLTGAFISMQLNEDSDDVNKPKFIEVHTARSGQSGYATYSIPGTVRQKAFNISHILKRDDRYNVKFGISDVQRADNIIEMAYLKLYYKYSS